MKVLMIGDIVGRPGRRAVKQVLPQWIKEHAIDLTIANGENAAGGIGITKEICEELFSYGVDALTMGNHVWDKKDIYSFIDSEPRIVRPANYPPGTPGQGYITVNTRGRDKLKVGVVNLSGRVFLSTLECPFRMGREIIEKLQMQTPIIIVDFHAEATSEKVAMGWYLDGRASAVLGTHTHIQTADARILPRGTAYVTDVGMTGPRDSVLGVEVEAVLQKFLTQMPTRFEVAGGVPQINAMLVEIDATTGKATGITPLQKDLLEQK
ncbi:MAG: TIGR00282 family metallophosphoesterase [Bacillota bacterium]